MIIYGEYINRTLSDYLCALRSSPTFIFTIDEMIYVLRHVAKACIALKSTDFVMKEWELRAWISIRRKYSSLPMAKFSFAPSFTSLNLSTQLQAKWKFTRLNKTIRSIP